MFKSIKNFEGVIEIAGVDVETLIDGDGLNLKVSPQQAMEILAYLAKMTAPAILAPVVVPRQAAKQKAVTKADPPASTSAPSTLQGSTSGKMDVSKPAAPGRVELQPLQTPDELRARREASQKQQTQKDNAERAAVVKEAIHDVVEKVVDKVLSEDEEEPQDRAPLPEADKLVEARQSKQFVEDLDVDKAKDAAAAVESGDAVVPGALAKAKNLKEILAYFWEHNALRTAADLVDACESWRASLPIISRIDKKSLRSRVENQLEINDFGATAS